MRFYLDTEFIEGPQDKRFMGIKYGKTKPTIDLISIGIVDEYDNVYYAVSKDFNLHEAWYRYDLKTITESKYMYLPIEPTVSEVDKFQRSKISVEKTIKEYWLRDNVLKPIWNELVEKYIEEHYTFDEHYEFSYYSMQSLLKLYGKSNKQIGKEVRELCKRKCTPLTPKSQHDIDWQKYWDEREFYGYYSDYDWVVFCWLFGLMKDLPDNMPMYCIDLKQDLYNFCKWRSDIQKPEHHKNYPAQPDKHHALEDAKWTKKLHEFLMQNQ